MSFLRTIPAALTAALLASPAALAETVTLTLLNGDTIQGELIPEESTDDVKVLMHPQLGRLEVSQDALKPVEKPPAWKTTLSAGINQCGQQRWGWHVLSQYQRQQQLQE